MINVWKAIPPKYGSRTICLDWETKKIKAKGLSHWKCDTHIQHVLYDCLYPGALPGYSYERY